MQCDNGGEFLTTSLRDLFSRYGASFRLACPHTSPQHGKAERLVRTTNDILRVLLIHANLAPPFWVEALHSATYVSQPPTILLDLNLVSDASTIFLASDMNHLLRRACSADLNSPSPADRPIAAVLVARAAPVADCGKGVAPAVVPAASSFSSVIHGRPCGSPATILRTAGSTLVSCLNLGGGAPMVPRLDCADVGPSSTAGLPPSIAHHFHSKLELEPGAYSK